MVEVKHDFFGSVIHPGVSQGYDEVYKSYFTPANEELWYKALTYVKIADVCHKFLVVDGDGERWVSRGLCVERPMCKQIKHQKFCMKYLHALVL